VGQPVHWAVPHSDYPVKQQGKENNNQLDPLHTALEGERNGGRKN